MQILTRKTKNAIASGEQKLMCEVGIIRRDGTVEHMQSVEATVPPSTIRQVYLSIKRRRRERKENR
jgi:hypothetical protein